MLLCIGREDAILKLYPRTPGCDWKFAPTHARFTSNPSEYIAGFRPGGLKRLKMLLSMFRTKNNPTITFFFANVSCQHFLHDLPIA
jgi:hypothetical protein